MAAGSRKQKTPPKRGSKLVGERGFEPQAALLAEILLFEFLVQFFKVVVRGGGLEPPRP